MAESHKTLQEDSNLSNKNRNNSVPNIVPHTSGTQTSDTHPTHHAGVSEPSTIKRKQTSFQITSVTVKGSRLSTDGGEDSADDLDESHTEDASSDILDCSKTTDVDNDQLSEDNSIAINNDDSATPSIPNKCKTEQPVQGEQLDNNVPSKDSTIDKSSEGAAPSEPVKEPPPDQWQHRFRVVKIVSSEPFKRGRWLCTDFMDPPAPITEAKAEIVETAVNTNIQMISGSLSDSIPADKIAHIYEISPGNAYSGSITVNDGSDQIRQPMYGIFLPLNNKQYPLITGMHSLAVQPRDQQRTSAANQTQVQNIPTTHQMQNATSMQQVQTAVNQHPPQNISVNVQQSQNIASVQQSQNIANVQQSQNIANVQQPQNVSVSFHQSQNAPASLQQSQNATTMQHVQTVTSNLPASQNITGMTAAQNYPNSMQVTPNVTSIQQSQVTAPVLQQHVNVTQHPSNLQTPNVTVNAQPNQNVNANYQQSQNVHTGYQQPQNVVTSMSQPQNVTNFQQPPASVATSLQHQNVITNIQQTQNVASCMVVPPSAHQQPQHVTSTQQSQQVTNMQQPHIASMSQPQNVVTSMYQPQNAVPQQATSNLKPSQSLQQSQSYQQIPISSQSTNGNQQPIVGDGLQAVNTQSIPNPVISTTNFQNEPSSRMEPHNATADLAVKVQAQQPPQESRPLQGQTLPSTPPESLSETPNTQASNDIVPPVPMIVDTQVGSVQPASITVSQASPVSNIPEVVSNTSMLQTETVVPSQVTENHVEGKELGTPPSTNTQVVQEIVPETATKTDVNGEEPESVPSGTSTVAIDNKIEQAMDLVKSHLMFAVREEVDVLKEKITELMDRISQLEYENGFLRANASQQTLEQLNQSQQLQQQQQQQIQPPPVPMNLIPQQPVQQQQTNIQNQQPTS